MLTLTITDRVHHATAKVTVIHHCHQRLQTLVIWHRHLPTPRTVVGSLGLSTVSLILQPSVLLLRHLNEVNPRSSLSKFPPTRTKAPQILYLLVVVSDGTMSLLPLQLLFQRIRRLRGVLQHLVLRTTSPTDTLPISLPSMMQLRQSDLLTRSLMSTWSREVQSTVLDMDSNRLLHPK